MRLTCRVCGRHLIARESREAGIGPVCAGREAPPKVRAVAVERCAVWYDPSQVEMWAVQLTLQMEVVR